MYWDMWNGIDWINIFMVVIIMTVYFYCNFLVGGLKQLHEQMPQVEVDQRYSAQELGKLHGQGGFTAYEMHLDALIEQARLVVVGYSDLKWYITVFSVACAFKFLKAFRANPKLNVVTQTIMAASTDLAHFLIVFTALLMAFVLVAHVLFGSQMTQFSTFGEALNTCLLSMLGYTFDNISANMFKHGKELGTLWVWLFNIGVVCLLLNMVLAIIFDVYAEVKTKAGESPSLVQQALDLWNQKKSKWDKRRQIKRALKQKKMQRSDSFLQGSFQNMMRQAMHHWTESALLTALKIKNKHPDQVITADSLADALDAGDDQIPFLELILENATSSSDLEQSMSQMSLTDSIRLIGRIDRNLQDVVKRQVQDTAFAEGKTENSQGLSLDSRLQRIEDAIVGLTAKIDANLKVPGPPRVASMPMPPELKTASVLDPTMR